jgi:hypothetical protein
VYVGDVLGNGAIEEGCHGDPRYGGKAEVWLELKCVDHCIYC